MSHPTTLRLLTVVSLFAACLGMAAPPAAAANFDPLQTFAPFPYPQSANAFRTGTGRPGPLYWQNRADYQIKATLDPATRKLIGEETITYTNHSPNDLDTLWLQLEQNRYRKDARGAFGGDTFPTEFTDGEDITSVAVEGVNGKFRKAEWLVSDTRMQVRLPQPLRAYNGKVRVRIVYGYTVPAEFGDRTDVNPSKNGAIFEIAQWYPRMCVYDDLRGWTTDPYLNNEFYLEYGDYDYSVTVPWDMIVVGSGELLNPHDVLTEIEMERLERARHSEATVMIRSPEEVNDLATRPRQSGTSTWHFRIRNSRDAVFGASKAYVWDAARINLPNGRHALAESAYPVESAGRDAWGRATEYVKAATEYFSKQWYPYPYPVAINEAGSAGGMEYPSITFDSKNAKGGDLHALIAHEIGHTWFPMIVGTDERRNAWMDEGFDTFIDVYEADHFNHGEYAPKRDAEYAPTHGNPADEVVKVLTDPDAPPLLTRADQIEEKFRHPVTYFKSAFGLVLLREQIIGPERFDPAFREYIRTWAYRHPDPADFFRFIESETGEDLSWFWRGWYEHNWKLDLAVQNVTAVGGDWSKGALVTVANLDKLVMPATLEVLYTDGSKQDIRVPVETWMQHRSYAVRVVGDKPVKSAVIDPAHVLPDVDRGNNSFTVAR